MQDALGTLLTVGFSGAKGVRLPRKLPLSIALLASEGMPLVRSATSERHTALSETMRPRVHASSLQLRNGMSRLQVHITEFGCRMCLLSRDTTEANGLPGVGLCSTILSFDVLKGERP